MRANNSTFCYSSKNRYKINQSAVYITTRPLTNRWKRGFEAAKSAITELEGKPLRHCLGAAIFHGNRLLSTGVNGVKTKPENVVSNLDGSEYCVTRHAEQAAVDGIRHRYEDENLKLIMYVVRVSARNKLVTSKPCNLCIDEQGIPEEMTLN